MVTLWYENSFCIPGPLCGEVMERSYAIFCVVSLDKLQTKTVKLPVIWDHIPFMWRHYDLLICQIQWRRCHFIIQWLYKCYYWVVFFCTSIRKLQCDFPIDYQLIALHVYSMYCSVLDFVLMPMETHATQNVPGHTCGSNPVLLHFYEYNFRLPLCLGWVAQGLVSLDVYCWSKELIF